MKVYKCYRLNIGYILISYILPALLTFVPFYCWYGTEFLTERLTN
jgi:hypothetical protein